MAVIPTAPQLPEEDNHSDFGDFAHNSDEEGDLEELAKPWHKYATKETPHVFYPICLGEVLNNRYLVEHKIGFGGFSTVWMAHDLQDKKDVALKDEITRSVQDTSHLVTYLATFMLPGDGGHHRALVLPLMGPPLCYFTARNMSVATRMSAAKQLLVALGNLHKAGTIHRGEQELATLPSNDLNERNCMWGMAPMHHLSRSAKYKALSRPLKEIIPGIDNLWKRGELVHPISIPDDLRTDELFLGDFDLAMKHGDPAPQRGYPPMKFCSPDRLRNKGLTVACDMWSYMIIFSILYLGGPPFPPFLKGGIISGIVRRLGPLPKEWKGLYTYPKGLDSWYDENQPTDSKHDLTSTIAYFRPDSDPAERKHVLSLMTRMFTYCPEKRLTAAELLQDPSFKAIMDKNGC
ncbi:serine/threonine protein kinase [Nannizzia gypsea CBS 118893]|uniref:Serine/threonine protein kinase n=1 Tax=Arthroderma gypseum (strain ATCC MYA-4604 / CBS 118893) TaxID=535722 RepID=E5QYI0_ARTGP|nr:serine/threonine protein kinase [Nannizzia gypsea CBS 118893]EFQ98056.1 serine/threonine protein kinase [Nannizzia gypsea CBS 118893]